MTQSIDSLTPIEAPTLSTSVDWQQALDSLAYAYGKPPLHAVFKNQPEDFLVTEVMGIEPSGEGEHFWLDMTKTKCNTDQLAKALARFSGVAYRDVSYSGLKDYFAVSRQWFSVWMPRGPFPDWQEFQHEGVVVHRIEKHNKKLKRGVHSKNKFQITLRDLHGDRSEFESRLAKIKMHGVPNYFGPQRFGRNVDNMRQAYAMLVGKGKVKNKNLRSLLLSSARSWLFNQIVSARVRQQTWGQLGDQEPANLHGSNSLFIAGMMSDSSPGAKSDSSKDELLRLNAMDIHPTAPLWGDGHVKAMAQSSALSVWEQDCIRDHSALMRGLEDARVAYQRRAIRSVAEDLSWDFSGPDLRLSFSLLKGQYATSVIRELVIDR